MHNEGDWLTTLVYCEITYHNDQREFRLLPGPPRNWAERVLQNRIYYGDVDIFCEHHGGPSDTWAIKSVRAYNFTLLPLIFWEVMLMSKKTWEVETFRFSLPKEWKKDIIRLAEEAMWLITDFDCEVISITEESP